MRLSTDEVEEAFRANGAALERVRLELPRVLGEAMPELNDWDVLLPTSATKARFGEFTVTVQHRGERPDDLPVIRSYRDAAGIRWRQVDPERAPVYWVASKRRGNVTLSWFGDPPGDDRLRALCRLLEYLC